MKKIISIDAETDGLRGEAFAIAGIIYEDGKETGRFMGLIPNSQVKNVWVKENVLPTLEGIDSTHETADQLLKSFSEWYQKNKEDGKIICHMGTPVEANLFQRAFEKGFIGEFDGPYPLIDVSGNLDQVGEDPTSVDGYARKHKLEISDYGTTHNPLYDCEVAAKVYLHLTTPVTA